VEIVQPGGRVRGEVKGSKGSSLLCGMNGVEKGMKSRLADLLDSPERVREIPIDSIPGLLAQLGGLQGMLSARLIDS
jgi:hypothetical protein